MNIDAKSAKDFADVSDIDGESVFFSAPDGLKLHAVDYGREHKDALPVVCLPGLSRNARDFSRLAGFLTARGAVRRRVICFDYRGRGLSQRDRNWRNYNIVTEAEDVLAGMAALNVGHAAFVGTSRGGLISMVLSAMRPAVIRAVVLNDVGPVIEGEGLAQIRALLTRLPKPGTWQEAAALQKEAVGKAFPALTDADFEFEARAKYREISKKIRPDHDPNLVRTLTAIDLGDRLPTLWPQFQGLYNVPVLLLRGENSTLLSDKTAEEMAARHPGLRQVEIKGQGHAPMLHTAGIPEIIAEFVDRAER